MCELRLASEIYFHFSLGACSSLATQHMWAMLYVSCLLNTRCGVLSLVHSSIEALRWGCMWEDVSVLFNTTPLADTPLLKFFYFCTTTATNTTTAITPLLLLSTVNLHRVAFMSLRVQRWTVVFALCPCYDSSLLTATVRAWSPTYSALRVWSSCSIWRMPWRTGIEP